MGKDGSIRVRNRQTASVRNRTAKISTSPPPWDKTEVAEFTAAWDRYRQRFNPFVACPECKHSDRVGQVEYERFEVSGAGINEPCAYWKDCDNCNGLGEIQADQMESDNG